MFQLKPKTVWPHLDAPPEKVETKPLEQRPYYCPRFMMAQEEGIYSFIWFNELEIFCIVNKVIWCLMFAFHQHPDISTKQNNTFCRQCMKCHRFMCLGIGGLGEYFLYWGFGQWHFVIGILFQDLIRHCVPMFEDKLLCLLVLET